MNRAIATFALGDHQQLLDLALPRFQDYATRHGYDLLSSPPRVRTRPPSWLKIPVLLGALDRYDAVLWLDADIVIVDGTLDIADQIPADVSHALVRHHTPDGEVPNCGVWYLRPEMRPVLEALWRMTRYLNHPWWEQAGLLELLGYHGHPVRLVTPTELYHGTCWLGLEWNSHEERDRHPAPRFAHATSGTLAWRLDVMHRYIQKGVTDGQVPPDEREDHDRHGRSVELRVQS